MASDKDIQNQNELNKGIDEQGQKLGAIRSLIDDIFKTEKLITEEAIERAKQTRELSKLANISYGQAKQFLSATEKQRDLQEELNNKIKQQAIDNSAIVKDQQRINDLYDKRLENEQKVAEYFSSFKKSI